MYLLGSLRGGNLFPKERVTRIDYGMGWYIYDYAGVTVVGHMGGMTGVRSIIAFIPSEKVGIVVLANLGGMRVSYFPEALRSFFFDLYLGLPDKHDWSHNLYTEKKKSYDKTSLHRVQQQLLQPQPAAAYENYVGDYKNDLYGVIKIREENKKLVLFYRNLKVTLIHGNGDNFSFTGSDLSPGLAAIDRGDIVFGFKPNSLKAFGFMVNLFREGVDPLFSRIS